jgi:hypothetical protein
MTPLFLLALAPAFAEAPAGGQTGPISLAEYRDRLRSIDDAVARQDFDAARSGARDLKALRVRSDGGDFGADATVLGPLAEAKNAAEARLASIRLRALRGDLESTGGSAAPKPPDAALLERLRREEAERQLSPGGRVGGPGLHVPVPRSVLDRIRDLLREVLEDLGRLLRRFLQWLIRLLVGGAGAAAQPQSTRYLVAGLVAAVLGILAVVTVQALRRRQRTSDSVAVSDAPAMSEKDGDPLSRTATEWERFAADLMRAGRFREAIRAWYHAVLVSLFRAGALHYRKDRTNWEYAFALPPTLAWRAGFMDATRTFEQEWYGRRDTAAETAELYQRRAQEMLAGAREGGAR